MDLNCKMILSRFHFGLMIFSFRNDKISKHILWYWTSYGCQCYALNSTSLVKNPLEKIYLLPQFAFNLVVPPIPAVFLKLTPLQRWKTEVENRNVIRNVIRTRLRDQNFRRCIWDRNSAPGQNKLSEKKGLERHAYEDFMFKKWIKSHKGTISKK